jgi:hypothetical protein
LFLDGARVGRQCFGPEPVQLGAQRADPVRVDRVDVAITDVTIHYESCLLQDLEVLGDCGATDGQVRGELADGLWTVCKTLEDRAPGRVA